MLTSILPAYVNKSRLLTYQYWSNFIAIPKLKQGGLIDEVGADGSAQDNLHETTDWSRNLVLRTFRAQRTIHGFGGGHGSYGPFTANAIMSQGTSQDSIKASFNCVLGEIGPPWHPLITSLPHIQ